MMGTWSHIPPFAVVDIGSNTVKVSAFGCTDGDLDELAADADTVRVGWRVAETGRIAPDRQQQLLETLKRFERLARSHGAEEYHAVATQAFRTAHNAQDVIDAVHAHTSGRVKVITPEEETTLTRAGAERWIDSGVVTVVADIGGASTEIVTVDENRNTTASGSVPIGSGLLFDEEINSTPPPAGSIERARTRAGTTFDATSLVPDMAHTLLLPGGTGHFLNLLVASISNGATLEPDTLGPLHSWLSEHDAQETMSRIPVQLDRAKVLPASLAVVEALVLRCTPQRILAVPSGIRRAVAQEACFVQRGDKQDYRRNC